MSNWAGRSLGKVQIESRVARGGAAEVYVGTHTTLERKVAVKILHDLNEENSDALERFQREARVIAKLRHGNIVQVHDFDTVENDPYLVMEYIAGPSLSRYLNVLHENNQRLPLPQVVRLLSAIANALQYAHNHGVVHRDIKPGNILLTSPTSQIVAGKPLPEDFEPVLTDFGLVRFLDSNRQTTTGQIAGTPAYMSPEQARGETTDGRTDVYSLGIVLYEILAGHVPFDGETTMSILLKHVTEPPPPIPDLPPFIQNVLNRVLAKDVRDRFQTPLDFANTFSAVVDMEGDPSTIQLDSLPAASTPPQTRPPWKLGPRWLRAALLTGISVALGAFFYVNRIPASPSETNTPTIPSPSVTEAVPSATYAGVQLATQLGPTAILRFQNGVAVGDQAVLIASAMPAPPADHQYEIWLIGTDERISLGIFVPDSTGQGTLTYSDPEGLNLIGLYDQVEVTIEPQPDPDPELPSFVAYSFSLPARGLTHVRNLLSSFPNAPGGTALVQGLYTDLQKIHDLAQEMQEAFATGDTAAAQHKAQSALNLLVGAQSAEFEDWNIDGESIDTTASYGLLLNGSNFGYIQAVYAEADYTVNTPNTTQHMIVNGEVVKICAQNLAGWAPLLREQLLLVLASDSLSEMDQPILNSVSLADQMLNGFDKDSNQKIEPIAAECGVLTTYEYALQMADMPLIPVGTIITPSPVATAATAIISSPTRSSGGGGGVAPTARPGHTPPGQVKTRRPPNNNNNGQND